MKLERLLIVTAVAAGAAGLIALTTVGANSIRQGDGVLAQEPLHLGETAAPNFIMAIDDSGSMTFQTMFPGKDGAACWSNSAFFTGTTINTSGTCSYHYVMPGKRAGTGFYSIPPLPQFAFARSPDVNPSYYDPKQSYDPWFDADGNTMGPASTSATPMKPSDTSQGTIDLFSVYDSTATDDQFRIQDGMYIPSGTVYKVYECVEWRANGNCRRSDWVAKTSTGLTWSGGAAYLGIPYLPAMVYLKQSTAPAGFEAVDTGIVDACGTGCTLYGYKPVSADARQHFANWFAYYGNRNRAMIAGLTRSLKATESKLRVGYFTINGGSHSCNNGFCTDNYPAVTMRDITVPADKKALMTDVLSLGHSGSTPNRYAVAHIGRQFDTNTNVIQYACQKNAGMLFTDGYSNQDGPNGYDLNNTRFTYDNADQNMGVPYTDGHNNTLADIAAHFYNKQLRTGGLTPGKVPVSNPQICAGTDQAAKKGLDCNSNPHMNFYGVTLGAKGKLFGVSYGVKADGTSDGLLATQQALAGTASPAWEVRTNDNPNTVDEIWHATMNARGQYINARTPADITNAMRNVLASVGVGGGASGSLAITGSRLGDNSLSITPRFERNGTDWYGDVVASKPSRELKADGTVVFTYSQIWTAGAQLPSAAARKLFYATTTGDSTPDVADFYTNGPGTLSLAALCANYASGCGPVAGADVTTLGVDITQAIHYLSGDTTLEASKLRKRTSPIGDIINSTPVVSAPTDDHGYALLRKADGSFEYDPYRYNAYLKTKSTRKRMVYVGANDGMLHGFNGLTGAEVFGYIPATAVGYMGNLLFPSSPNYQHRYLVDGPVVVSDALFGTTWKTVLVGTAGAGGRSVFGLDVTSAPNSGFQASDVLWEVNDRVTGEAGDRIGYVLGKPVIVAVRGSNGKPEWKAIFGGGYANRLNEVDATKGTVTLFVVDMASGDVDYIDAKETDGPVASNGLGNIVAIDRYQYNDTAGGYLLGSDGMVDTVYGGDLQGNVWKFDLTKSNKARAPSKPLFTARDGILDTDKRQPITGGFEAAVGPRGGVMVLFGTGGFSFTGDKLNTDVQTMYGVLDMPDETIGLPLTRSNLVAQTLAADGVVTNNTVNFYTKRGWYLDLGITASDGFKKVGERAVGYPKIEGGTLYFTTYAPTPGDECSGGGANYLYGLSTLSGGGNLGTVKVGSPKGSNLGEGTGRLSLTTDGSAPVKDVSVYTTGKQGGLTGTPDDAAIAKYNSLDPEYCMAIVSVAGGQPLYRVRPCGRQSWRQIR